MGKFPPEISSHKKESLSPSASSRQSRFSVFYSGRTSLIPILESVNQGYLQIEVFSLRKAASETSLQSFASVVGNYRH